LPAKIWVKKTTPPRIYIGAVPLNPMKQT